MPNKPLRVQAMEENFTFRLTAKQKAKLEDLGRKTTRPMGEVLRRLIEAAEIKGQVELTTALES